MRGKRYGSWDGGQGDLFVSPEGAARGFDLAALPSFDAAPTGDPVELLRQVRQRADELLTLIESTRIEVVESGGDRQRTHAAAAVATVDACARLASLAYAQQLRAIALVHGESHTQLIDDDAQPGDPRPVGADGASRGRYPTRASMTASVVGPVLGLSAGGAHTQVRRALALRDRMPHARQRLIDGDWGEFHLALAIKGAARLDDDAVSELDAGLHAVHERISPMRITSRIDSWLARRGLPTPAEDAHDRGVEARRVWFGPVDLFGMRAMGAYLRAADVTALQTAVSDLAATGAADDPHERDQVIADTFVSMFQGPGALATAVCGQLRLPSVTHDGPGGYAWVDDAQSAEVASVWQTITMLLGTLDLTVCKPPQAHLDVTVSLQTLLELKAGLVPGHPDHELERLARNHAHPPPGRPPDRTSTSPPANEHSGDKPPRVHDVPPSIVPDESQVADPRAFAAGVGALSHDVLLMLMAQDLRMRRVMLGPVHGQPINLGRSRYVPSRSMAARVRLRDKHCRFPGCHRPATHPAGRAAELDHIDPHRSDGSGGATADASLAVLCAEHHKIKHHTAWSPELHDDGSITWRNNYLGLALVTRPGDQT